jgi:hypothetical protein
MDKRDLYVEDERLLNFQPNQGDQIGRIFTQRVIDYFGQFFYYRNSPEFCAIFNRG